jgi:hypothetical protein
MANENNFVSEGVLLTFKSQCEKLNFMDKQSKKGQVFGFVK